MKYYKITATTPYCGTEAIEYIIVSEVYDNPEEIAKEYAEELNQNNADSYVYLIEGWDNEPTEEELENYYADCEGFYEEISREEYEENIGENYISMIYS